MLEVVEDVEVLAVVVVVVDGEGTDGATACEFDVVPQAATKRPNTAMTK